jgi:hypothetical protein
MRIANLRNNLKTRAQKSTATKSASPNPLETETEMLQRHKAFQGVTEQTRLETATLWRRRNTVSGCPWLRMNIHKRIFSSIVETGLSALSIDLGPS